MLSSNNTISIYILRMKLNILKEYRIINKTFQKLHPGSIKSPFYFRQAFHTNEFIFNRFP